MLTAYIILNALLAALFILSRTKVAHFLRETPRMATPDDLARYKAMVTWQMYAALAYLPFGLASFAWSVYIGRTQGLFGLAVVLLVCGPTLWICTSGKSAELRARSLDADEAIAGDYASVSEAWLKKLIPRF